MELRMLEAKDAPLMLEWMHDGDVVSCMGKNFMSMTIEDCNRFIENAKKTNDNLHLAIVDESDCYMGTVSLKNISQEFKSAEFAITVRHSAMGKGYSGYALKKIIDIAFAALNLTYVYWYVNADNLRAIRFYDKSGVNRVDYDTICSFATNLKIPFEKECLWYCVCSNEWKSKSVC